MQSNRHFVILGAGVLAVTLMGAAAHILDSSAAPWARVGLILGAVLVGAALFFSFRMWRRLEKELRDREAFLHSIVENVPNMIFVKEAQGLRFVLFNRAGEEVLGKSREELLGRGDFDFFPPSQADFFQQKDRQVLEGRNLVEIDTEPLDTPRGRRWLRTKKVPILDKDGEPRFLLGISEDVTDRLKMEAEVERSQAIALHQSKMASLGVMAGGVAHEINNPLAIIGLNASRIVRLVDRKADTRTIAAHATAIENEVHRIAKIVKGLRAIARDTPEDPFEWISVPELLENVLSVCREKFSARSVDLTVDNRAGEVWLQCRSVEISHVLLNLLSNAFDATENLKERWVRVEIRQDGNWLCIAVSDSGRGIPEPVRSRVLEPFFTTKPVGRGSGLGLSICASIAELHHGKLVYDDKSPHTRFEVILPLTQPSEAVASAG